VAVKYFKAMTEAEMSPDFNLKRFLAKPIPDGRSVLLMRLVKSGVGVRLTKASLKNYLKNVGKLRYPFMMTDMKTLCARLKVIDFGEYYEGLIRAEQALVTQDCAERKHLHTGAVRHFVRCLSRSNSDWSFYLRSLAHSLSILDKNDLTDYYFKRAIEDHRDSEVLFSYALFIEKCDMFRAAEEYYLKALEEDPNHPVYLCTYADFLAYHDHNFVDAAKFYHTAIGISERSDACNNFACILLKRTQVEVSKTPRWELTDTISGYMEKADTHFKRALKLDKKANSIHLRNYAFFLQEFKKGANSVVIAEKARTLFFLADKVDSIDA